MGRSAWLDIRNATNTGFPKSLCQEDRRWQIVRGVSRGPDIVEMVSMEGALDVDVLQLRKQSREMFQNTLIFLGPLELSYITIILGIGFYLDFPNRARDGEDGRRILELSTIGLPWLLNLKKTNAGHVFKRNLNRFLGTSS